MNSNTSTTANDDLVPEESACPRCGERRMDWLIFLSPDDDRVRCTTCGHEYNPFDDVEGGSK